LTVPEGERLAIGKCLTMSVINSRPWCSAVAATRASGTWAVPSRPGYALSPAFPEAAPQRGYPGSCRVEFGREARQPRPRMRSARIVRSGKTRALRAVALRPGTQGEGEAERPAQTQEVREAVRPAQTHGVGGGTAQPRTRRRASGLHQSNPLSCRTSAKRSRQVGLPSSMSAIFHARGQRFTARSRRAAKAASSWRSK
jgi:hypothetical protein